MKKIVTAFLCALLLSALPVLAAQPDALPSAVSETPDWHLLGKQAFEQGKYEAAAEHFNRAAAIAETPVDMAKALYGKGVTLGQLQRSEEAIAVCNEVVKRYGDAPEAATREHVVKAMGNKGFRLGQLQRSEEAIAVYDEVVKRYGDAPEAGTNGTVARVLILKNLLQRDRLD